MTIGKVIGTNIRKLRKEKKLTQEQLAKKIGITSFHLLGLEKGNRTPSIKLLEKIAVALEVPPYFLLIEPEGSAWSHNFSHSSQSVSSSNPYMWPL